ncbi:MAG: AAA domain-containing protein, partial [Candidatus Eisenbacteria bacterium]|nr:AAA domain-containing protein [Candidatus Eisenbacteria bacterium]
PGLREQILAALEQGWILVDEGRCDELGPVLSRISRLMAQGSGWGSDLTGEVRRLEGWNELVAGRPAKAQGLFAEAEEASRQAYDPVGADAARLGVAVSLRALLQHDAADIELRSLAERLRQRGEKLSLGKANLELGHTLNALEGRGADSLQAYEEATRLFQELGVPHLETESWLAQGTVCLGEGDLEGARARLSLARKAGPPAQRERLARLERELLRRLSRAFEQRANSGLSGFDVFRRVEGTFAQYEADEILDGLREVLGIVRTALDGDAILYGVLNGQRVEILGSRGMDRLDGRRTLPLKALAPDGRLSQDRARILIDPQTGEAGRGAGSHQGSALLVPVDQGDVTSILYVERRAESGRPPFQPGEGHYGSALALELSRGLRRKGWRREVRFPQSLQEMARGIYVADIVTQSPKMFRILELIYRVAPTDMTVLLQGETGTGKKLLAEAIHRMSPRGEKGFVTVDCAALPESLLETELFGYRRGAFTGAAQDREGLLGDADGGTIFLDEIGKAGIQVQRRFLHLLDTGEVRPVGATSYRRLDVRVVAATSSPDLSQEVAAGRFLKDLYYRLNDITISVPPLRERKTDVPLLAETFAEIEGTRIGRRNQELSASLVHALVSHDWPGNVRELEKAIRRAVTLGGDDALLTADLLPDEVSGHKAARRSRQTLKSHLEQMEREFILQALEQTGWNKSRTARALGLSRKGLRNKIERYRLEPPRQG